jgi:hypothetical protein
VIVAHLCPGMSERTSARLNQNKETLLLLSKINDMEVGLEIDMDAVGPLLANGGDMDVRDPLSYCSPLISASACGNIELVRFGRGQGQL